MNIQDQTTSPILSFLLSTGSTTRSYHRTNQEESYRSPTIQLTNKERKGKDPVPPSGSGGGSSTIFQLPISADLRNRPKLRIYEI